ncbi:MAG: hypothetical protein LBP59_19715 [Planctomycetaceae bacterium]|nr:hypothetical protein [Planctomycetaceae bacterium]
MQARRPRSWDAGVPPANLKDHRRNACDPEMQAFRLRSCRRRFFVTKNCPSCPFCLSSPSCSLKSPIHNLLNKIS